MRHVMIIVAVILCLSSRSFAQPSQTSPTAAVEEKSESTAVLLSLGVTTGGVVTLLAGGGGSLSLLGLGAVYFGPSTGQWYAGEVGGLGLGLRAAGAVTAMVGLSQLLQSENDCEPELDGDCSAENARSDRAGTTGALLMWTGAGLWIGSTIYDVILARRAAARWNERHALSLAPMTFSAGGQSAHGLVLGGRF